MSAQNGYREAGSAVVDLDAVESVIGSLHLESSGHPRCSHARLVRKTGHSQPVAAILEQGESFLEDRRAIECLKADERELPIIYLSRATPSRRETAIRRLGIHYFLASPVEGEELNLVLEALLLAHVTTAPYERRFIR